MDSMPFLNCWSSAHRLHTLGISGYLHYEITIYTTIILEIKF